MSDFVHLHVHTEYSLLDGAAKIKEAIETAKAFGQKAIAITDHGAMYGVLEFYRAAKKAGIKPIIGCEVYVAARTRFDKERERDRRIGHLILLAKNNVGYHNLVKLVSLAFLDGFYYKPRVDIQILKKYSEGLIALSACLAGEIPRYILEENYDAAYKKALEYKEIFGDDFYLELQDHGLEQDGYLISKLIDLSNTLNIPLVSTNDVHYVKKEDWYIQNVLMCVQMNKTIHEPNDMAFKTHEFYLKSTDEMTKLFADTPSAISNTVEIADKCNVEFEFGKFHLPKFKMDKDIDSLTYLQKLCYKGLNKRYGDSQHKDRLDYELSIIKQMGFVDYFLIVYDFIRYAKEHDIPVGPGRGSAAGSIVSYCLGITEIDPIKYGLLFERFLNPERISMPDIDIDFCYEKRQKVIDYVISKYGSKSVSQIATFGTLAARAAIRDIGRALGISYSVVDSVAKLIPYRLNMTIDKAMQESPELRDKYEASDEIKNLIDTAKRVEGFPRHISTHAAGVVITEGEISDYVPLALSDETVVTQFPMTELENLGLLKMDFLGLRNLTVIHDTETQIQRSDPKFKIKNISLEDKAVFKLLSSGNTFGVFQLESAGMRKLLQNMCPTCIEDIIAAISLYRPGPMDSIPRYLKNREHPDKIKYKTELLSPILSVTYGCIIYQEQVMQIVRKLAGYSYARADLVRKAMSKKNTDVMNKEREIFINGLIDSNGSVVIPGAVRNGLSKKIANEIFDEMCDFAKYAFNKSHASGYALIAYQTAYLKCHYPYEYMASLLTSVQYNTDKIVEYVAECKRMNIPILPPDINRCYHNFIAEKDGILFGLAAVKNVGAKFIKEIVLERSRGEFDDFSDFVRRISDKDINSKRAIESLIKCGAFDSMGVSRKHLLEIYEDLIRDIQNSKNSIIAGQIDFFEPEGVSINEKYFAMPVGEFETSQKLRFEKEAIGVYLSEHPLKRFEHLYDTEKLDFISDVIQNESDYDDLREVKLLGVVNSIKVITTRHQNDMAYIGFEDLTQSIELIVFPAQFSRYKSILETGKIYAVKGKVSRREDEAARIVVDYMEVCNESEILEKLKRLYIRLGSKSSAEYKQVIKMLKAHPGNNSCIIHFIDTKKSISTDKQLKVSLDYSLIVGLKQLLGEENIVVK